MLLHLWQAKILQLKPRSTYTFHSIMGGLQCIWMHVQTL